MASLDRKIWARLWNALRRVLASEVGNQFKLMLGAILLLLVGINALNVVSSYVGRDLMTAIEQRSIPRFFSNAFWWFASFAGLTIAAVILRYIEERLALLWRDWLTQQLLEGYLRDGAYLRLKARSDLGNPDQRISEDARAFTGTTLSFFLMVVNAAFGIVAFSGVLWSISPVLLLAAVGYAVLGSVCTVALGRPLVRLSYDQSDREASFRSELVHVRDNAESVALLQLESTLRARLRQRLRALVENWRRIVAVNRNVGFFTTGYNYGIQLLPPLIVGPLFMAGKVQFGVITQSAMGLAQLLGAFSLIVNQFGSISSYAVVLLRVGAFSAALDERARGMRVPSRTASGLERVVFNDLTLQSSQGECLLAHLTLTLPRGTRLLVTGTEEARRVLFRAIALGTDAPEGSIAYPDGGRVAFLPERPYVPPGSLRDLVAQGDHVTATDAEICEVLTRLGLARALERAGGLDTESDYSHALSLGEQQLLAVTRVLLAAPGFVVLHNPGTTLAPEQLALVLELLSRAGVTYLTLGGTDAPAGAYDAVLEVHAGGSWGLRHTAPAPERPSRAS